MCRKEQCQQSTIKNCTIRANGDTKNYLKFKKYLIEYKSLTPKKHHDNKDRLTKYCKPK